MKVLTLECPSGQAELLIAELAEYGTLGIQETPVPGGRVQLDAWFPDTFDWPGGVWTDAPDTDWAQGWQAQYEPELIGDRIFLVPDWRDDPTPPGRIRLAVRPKQASGSGYQPATRLALRALEVALQPGDRFLDVGTGSGILIRAAEALGCRWAAGCDVDPQAATEAREWGSVVFQGSPRSLAGATFDCIAANVNAQGLLLLRAELRRVLAPGGRLILCGFKHRHLAALQTAFGLRVDQAWAELDWRCLLLSSDS